jgi:hypothetical protein
MYIFHVFLLIWKPIKDVGHIWHTPYRIVLIGQAFEIFVEVCGNPLVNLLELVRGYRQPFGKCVTWCRSYFNPQRNSSEGSGNFKETNISRGGCKNFPNPVSMCIEYPEEKLPENIGKLLKTSLWGLSHSQTKGQPFCKTYLRITEL